MNRNGGMLYLHRYPNSCKKSSFDSIDFLLPKLLPVTPIEIALIIAQCVPREVSSLTQEIPESDY